MTGFLHFGMILMGMACGWAMLFSAVLAPSAVRDLDRGRSDRFLRNVIRRGHYAPAGLSGVGGLALMLGGSVAGGLVLVIAGALFMAAHASVAPGAAKRGATRVIASAITALLIPLTMAAGLLAAMGI